MEDFSEVSLLLDFYGQLITMRQFEVLDLHYNNDYSLGEIAEQMNISRQGVYDNIKKGKAALLELEEKLKLIQRFKEQSKKAREILNLLDGINGDVLSAQDQKRLNDARRAIVDIMED